MKKKCFGAIMQRLLDEGFEFLHLKMLKLTKEQAEGFYEVHKEKPFFSELVEFMTSGPVIVIALERENAVLHLREIMGSTDPKKAPSSTIRAIYGMDIQRNAIHGSDSKENALKEINYFFAEYQIMRSPL
ncbi:MAG: nucleoside-diphosphate kinase [Thermoanaerobaculaceae bacterium]|nr:nucleoside-diphosphate kinase [Thermoanaerobaculaceae bacterium]